MMNTDSDIMFFSIWNRGLLHTVALSLQPDVDSEVEGSVIVVDGRRLRHRLSPLVIPTGDPLNRMLPWAEDRVGLLLDHLPSHRDIPYRLQGRLKNISTLTGS